MDSLYRTEAPGDWGSMHAPLGGTIGTARLSHANQTDIFYRFWHTDGPATLLWLHGLGAHSGWFNDVGNAIAAQGVNFYAMDHQGFGRSGGTRGHIRRWQTYLDDIDRMVDTIRHDRPDTRLFLLGHSMGGVFATHYAAGIHQDKLRGVILLNPWIDDTTKPTPGFVLQVVTGGVRGSNKVVSLPNPKATRGMTSNPEADRLLTEDPYWVYDRTTGFYWQILQMRNRTLSSAAKITLPVLVLQAEGDLTVVPKATRKAFERIASKDKTYTTYPGYGHDSQFEPDRTVMDNDIVTWINKHS